MIKSLPVLRDGSINATDPVHRSSKLSPLNKKRIVATPKNGGSATSWKRGLIPLCYRKESGKSYMVTVYGRMRWDHPAPTMTTHCTTLGTGRFGHPTQNRAISLREAARFQTFPDSYAFADEGNINVTRMARHIGNAVPVLLGRTIGKSIKRHVRRYT
jgi:DNA (cytosine-5)-methyltransferase 1